LNYKKFLYQYESINRQDQLHQTLWLLI